MKLIIKIDIIIEKDKQELFEQIKEILNKPLKQIKINNSKNNYNKLVWMKRSTANYYLLDKFINLCMMMFFIKKEKE